VRKAVRAGNLTTVHRRLEHHIARIAEGKDRGRERWIQSITGNNSSPTGTPSTSIPDR
jgi:hypothetical protein